jgi:hypothetical protein
MVWKSNLEENEQEFIEDFGAKTGDTFQQPAAPARKPASKKPAVGGSRLNTGKKNESPGKQSINQSMPDHNEYAYPSVENEGVNGSGEELAQTLEKVVS